MKHNRCQMLALTLLRDAMDDALSQDSTDPDNIIILKITAERGRLKANALDFFFSKESEADAQFWCDVAGQSLKRFRYELRKSRRLAPLFKNKIIA